MNVNGPPFGSESFGETLTPVNVVFTSVTNTSSPANGPSVSGVTSIVTIAVSHNPEGSHAV